MIEQNKGFHSTYTDSEPRFRVVANRAASVIASDVNPCDEYQPHIVVMQSKHCLIPSSLQHKQVRVVISKQRTVFDWDSWILVKGIKERHCEHVLLLCERHTAMRLCHCLWLADIPQLCQLWFGNSFNL